MQEKIPSKRPCSIHVNKYASRALALFSIRFYACEMVSSPFRLKTFLSMMLLLTRANAVHATMIPLLVDNLFSRTDNGVAA